MNISFCGHKNVYENIKDKILATIENVAIDPVEFYLGDDGIFDTASKNAAIIFKKNHPNAKLFFVSPYIDKAYLKKGKMWVSMR